MNRMYCCLPIGMKLRELDSHVNLAFHLLLRGHRCIIGQRTEMRRHIRKNAGPFMVISNNAFFPRKLFGRLAETGSILAVLDQEGGVFDKDLSSFSRRTAPEMLAHADAYLAWGEAQREYLLQERPSLDPSRIHVVGHPRFDHCRPSYVPFFSSRRPLRDRVAPGYILVNTSFGMINHHLGEDYLRFVMNRRGVPPENVVYKTRRRELQKTVLPRFIEAVLALSSRFPGQRIVVRPHPIERKEVYTEAFQDCANVEVICEGPVSEWIADASLVVFYDCTSGIEAMLFGKPAVSYCPVVDEGAVQWLPLKAGYRITELDRLLATIDEHLVSRHDPAHFLAQYDMALVKRWIANTDFCSADRVAGILENLMYKGPDSVRVASIKTGFAARFLHRVVHAAGPRLRRFGAVTGLSKTAAEKDLVHRKRAEFHKTTFDGLAADEIRSRLDWLMAAEQHDLAVAIRRLAENTYLLETERNSSQEEPEGGAD